MAVVAQLIINGLIAGSIYALVAAGFSLIFSTNKFMHFAHGSSVVIAGYLLFTFFSLWHIPFYLSCLLTVVLTGVLGVVLHRFVYLPLEKKNASTVVLLIASIGLLMLFQNLLQIIFSASVKTIGYVQVAQGVSLFGASITPLQIAIILLSFFLLILLYWFMKYTALGRNMRAIADNKELAEIIGIDHIKVASLSFFIGSALAGIAGILIGLEQNVYPTMGTMLIVKGFTGAVIGGIDFVPGSILGSYLLGLIENIGIWFIPSGYKDALSFALLFIFLLFRPQGLFGINKGVRK